MPCFFFLFDNKLVWGLASEAGIGGREGRTALGGVVARETRVLVVPPAASLSRPQRLHLQNDFSGTCSSPLPRLAFLSGHSEHQVG